MLSFEDTAGKIWGAVEFRRQLLIGGLLFYIPVLNLLWFGYLGLLVRRVLRKRGGGLPAWSSWRPILQSSLRILPAAAVYGLLPVLVVMLLGGSIAGLLDWIGLSLLGWVLFFFLLGAISAVIPAVLVSAIMEVEKGATWNVFPSSELILHRVIQARKQLLFPTFCLFGIMLLGFALLGWAAFAGILPYTLYCTNVFLSKSSFS